MVLDRLLHLAHALAVPEHDMAILAEGNVSAREDEETFWVKGSGQRMESVEAEGFSRVRFEPILDALRQTEIEDPRAILNSSCVEGPPPSTEAFMHAALLAPSEAAFVAHVHPTPLLSLLSLEGALEWATKRLFPDEIVLCGPASCFVPYVAPGIELAREIQTQGKAFRERYGIPAKTFWLQNHGLIVVGKTPNEVESACLMSTKAARVLLGALQTGRTVRWLSERDVSHIFDWPDEHARQRALWEAR